MHWFRLQEGEELHPQFDGIVDDMLEVSDAGGLQYPYMILACEFEVQKDTFSQVRACTNAWRDDRSYCMPTAQPVRHSPRELSKCAEQMRARRRVAGCGAIGPA